MRYWRYECWWSHYESAGGSLAGAASRVGCPVGSPGGGASRLRAGGAGTAGVGGTGTTGAGGSATGGTGVARAGSTSARRQETLSPERLREWAVQWGSLGGGASRARSPRAGGTGGAEIPVLPATFHPLARGLKSFTRRNFEMPRLGVLISRISACVSQVDVKTPGGNIPSLVGTLDTLARHRAKRGVGVQKRLRDSDCDYIPHGHVP
ncbi:unnamed protein product [Closterium sp. NIES-53]